MLAQRQLRPNLLDAGGQLFAEIRESDITLVEATGPRRTDRRTRNTYEPDRAAEQAEILKFHAQGWHFIGDWHTHPVARPQPSERDLASMKDCVKKSIHPFRGFLLLIVGQLNPPSGFSLTIHDGDQLVGYFDALVASSHATAIIW